MSAAKSPDARYTVMVLASTYPRFPGDPEPGFVHEMCKRLAKLFRVIVVTPSAPGTKDRETMEGVDVVRYRYAPRRLETLVHNGGIVTNLRRAPLKIALLPTFLLGQWLVARRLKRDERLDVIHAHWIIPQGLLGALLRIPMVVTCHGADVFALKGFLFARLRRYVLKRAHAITVVSNGLARALSAEWAGAAEPRVLPMGVDTALFSRDGTPRDAATLLFVGRMVEKKGCRYLIEAMPMVCAVVPSVRLTMVGFGPERPALEAQVRALGLGPVVTFTGALAQASLPDLYRRATLFVAPFVQASSGDQEGLGLVVAEAMATGCPVVVGDVEGVRDLVDASVGVLVDPTDAAALAHAIIAMLVDTSARERLGAAGALHVQRHFGWDATVSAYQTLLESAAARGA